MENFFWKSYENTHKFHLHDSYFISASQLKFLRAFQLILHSIVPLIYIFTLRILSSIKYLTIIGMYMTFIYFILINYTTFFPIKDHNRHKLFKRITILLFEVVFSLQFTITWFFWIILYPVYDTKELFPNWIAFFVVGLYMHSGCWIGLWVDKCFNTIHFDKKHLLLLATFMVCYAVFTFVYQNVYNKPIYPMLKWDGDSCGYMLIAIGFTLLHFYLGVWFSNYKSKKCAIYKKQKPEKSDHIK